MLTERQKEEAQKKIDGYRAAASLFPVVRSVLEAYNNKVYNCRLDKALKEAASEKGYIYCEKKYNYFHINFSPKNCHEWYTIASVKLEDGLTDGKRIKADVITDAARESRAALLKKAFDLEEAGRNYETIQKQLDALEKAAAGILDPLPYEARDLYNLRFRHRY